MDIALSETESLLQTTVRAYLKDHVQSPQLFELEGTPRYDEGTWDYLLQSGFVELAVPTAAGGPGGSLTEMGIVLEECARRPATVPLMETAVALLTAARFGTPDISQNMLDGVRTRKWTISPAVNSISMPTVSGGRLTGKQEFVDYGESATHHLVGALDNGRPALFLVATSGPGVLPTRVETIAGTPVAHFAYTDAPADKVCDRDGVDYLQQLARLFAAAQCLGSAQRAFEMTVEYVTVRVQFGRPIGSFQAVQHHLANMASMVTSCRFMVFEALWKFGEGSAERRDVDLAKAWASKTATEVPMMAHQLHGGIGVTREYDLQFLSRRGKERAVAWGTVEECLRQVATGLEAAS